MSLSKDELLQLMAYVDGEVEEGELPEVLALLAKSDLARGIVEQHSAVGDWVRASAEEHAIAGRADGIASAVMAEVAALDGAKVVAIQRGRHAQTRERIMAFGVLCAVAASVSLFYLWPHAAGRNGAPTGPLAVQNALPGAQEPRETASASGKPTAPVQVAAAEPEGQGIDVQAVESPDHAISIFYVPAATGADPHASSVVVWIGEE
jgi:negative regulator of sigma E activity